MKYKEDIGIANILAKKSAGEISADEQRLLEQWCENSAERGDMYARFMRGYSFSKQQENSGDIDNDTTIAAIYRKIDRQKHRKIVLRAASVAAVLVLGLFGAMYFSSLSEKDAPLLAGKHNPVISFNGVESMVIKNSEQEIEWGKYLNAVNTSSGFSTEYAGEIKIRVEIPRGGTHRVKLPDGSMVWLNSETVIEYPDSFTGESRNVSLKGEAFFEVKPDKEFPFIVSSENGTAIKVVGTSFNLNTHNDDYIEIILVTGQISVKVHGGEETAIFPLQRVVLDKHAGVIVVEDVDVAPYMAWKEHRIMFTDKDKTIP